jgi:ABC-2 type transport system ATP-binding protein
MLKLGKKQLKLHLQSPLESIPKALAGHALELSPDGQELIFTFDSQSAETGITGLLRRLNENGIYLRDLHSVESSLEEIFVNLVTERR